MVQKPIYAGPLHWKVGDPAVKAAMQSFYGQQNRSKWAGLPKPAYSIREYVSWWLTEAPRVKDPTCGRIDHSRGYSWDNIEIQSRSENSRECAIRLKKGSKQNPVDNLRPVFVYSSCGGMLHAFSSREETAGFFGVCSSTISARIRADRAPRRSGKFSGLVLRGES